MLMHSSACSSAVACPNAGACMFHRTAVAGTAPPHCVAPAAAGPQPSLGPRPRPLHRCQAASQAEVRGGFGGGGRPCGALQNADARLEIARPASHPASQPRRPRPRPRTCRTCSATKSMDLGGDTRREGGEPGGRGGWISIMHTCMHACMPARASRQGSSRQLAVGCASVGSQGKVWLGRLVGARGWLGGKTPLPASQPAGQALALALALAMPPVYATMPQRARAQQLTFVIA